MLKLRLWKPHFHSASSSMSSSVHRGIRGSFQHWKEEGICFFLVVSWWLPVYFLCGFCLLCVTSCLLPGGSLSTSCVTSVSCVWTLVFFLVCVCLLSHVQLFVTPWTTTHQAPLSMGCYRQEYWSGLPFPSLGDLPDPRIEPRSVSHCATWEALRLPVCVLAPVSHPDCQGSFLKYLNPDQSWDSEFWGRAWADCCLFTEWVKWGWSCEHQE